MVRGQAWVVVLSSLVIAALAGCVDGDPIDGSGSDGEDEDEPGDREEAVYTLPLTDTTWGHTDLTVLIVPPAYGELPGQVDPYTGTYLRAIEDSITHWQESIDAHGSDEIRGNVTFHVYVLGRDVLDHDDVGAVDILVVNPPKAPQVAPFSGLGLGLPMNAGCVVYNSIEPLEDEYDWIFALAGHEFGHCLGMGHPLDHDPWLDLMSYTDIYLPDGEEMPPLECVSNMNLAALHEAFGPAFGREAEGPITFPVNEYEIYECWDRFLPDEPNE